MKRPLNVTGETIRKRRKEAKLSLSALSAKCNLQGWDVAGSTLAKIECGKRSVFDCEILILGRVLKLSVTELFPHPVKDELLQACVNKPSRNR